MLAVCSDIQIRIVEYFIDYQWKLFNNCECGEESVSLIKEMKDDEEHTLFCDNFYHFWNGRYNL